MSQENTQKFVQQDEIDLRELGATLVKRKLAILTITFLITVGASIYAWKATPIYSGDVLIEIGDVIINSEATNDKPTIITLIENPNDLKEVLSQVLIPADMRKVQAFTIESPKGSAKLVKISYEAPSTDDIHKELNKASQFILKRHELKAASFQKANAQIRPSSIVGKIEIMSKPIKPKKTLIVVVAFITGLMLSVFLAFFLEFIGGSRKEEDSE
jgi:uncharacterized protein involved in exopolysaccharide biosynthesis